MQSLFTGIGRHKWQKITFSKEIKLNSKESRGKKESYKSYLSESTKLVSRIDLGPVLPKIRTKQRKLNLHKAVHEVRKGITAISKYIFIAQFDR